MLRETVFVTGGALLVALGVAFAGTLALAGIGWGGVYLYAYVALGVGLEQALGRIAPPPR